MTVSVLIYMCLLILILNMVLPETDPKIQRTDYVRLPGSGLEEQEMGKLGKGSGRSRLPVTE